MSKKPEPVMLTFCNADHAPLWAELLEGGNLRGALEAACNRLDADPSLGRKAAFCRIGEPDPALLAKVEEIEETIRRSREVADQMINDLRTHFPKADNRLMLEVGSIVARRLLDVSRTDGDGS